MIRPAHIGLEHLLERVDMLEFNHRFDVTFGKYLIPDLLTEEDYYDTVY